MDEKKFVTLEMFEKYHEQLMKHITGCDGCVHQNGCGYFDCEDYNLTEEERFIEHCIGCCCGDGLECNKAQGDGCTNWEDSSEPLLG